MNTNDSGETRFDEMYANSNGQVNEQQGTSDKDSNEETTKKTKMGKALFSGIAYAAAGIAGGAVLTGFVLRPKSEAINDLDAGNPSHSGHQVTEPSQFDGNEVPIAQNVTDDMSYGQAFAAARAEVGPGGVFEWRGKMYGTYYKEEWDSFSDGYKREFGNYNYNGEPTDDQKEEVVAQAVEEPNDGQDEEAVAQTIDTPEEPIMAGIFLDTPENMTLPDGTDITITCLYSNDNMDEPIAAFIDVDKDEVYDVQIFADGSFLPLDTPMTFDQLQTAGQQGELLLANNEIPDTYEPFITVMNDDDDVVVLFDEVNGHQVAYVPTAVDGNEVVFVDGIVPDEQGQPAAAPMDGNYDIAIMRDAETGEAQVLDITGQGVDNAYIQNIQDEPAADYPDYTADNQPDFNNDTDIDSFIA